MYLNNSIYKYFANQLRDKNIHLDQNQIEWFFIFLKELKKWNRKFNLTSITDDREIIVKHFIDSLCCYPAFPSKSVVSPSPYCSSFTPSSTPPPLRGRKKVGGAISVIDVGSGAGFPGLPLKIYRPEVKLTLLEATRKKVDFLFHICEKLELRDVEIIWGRAEEYAHRLQYREQDDIVVSRAVARLNVLAELCLGFVKPAGLFIAQKAGQVNEELKESSKAIRIMGGELDKVIGYRLSVGREEISRNLVVIKKVKATPEKYPRRAGIPAKRPIV